VTQAEWFARIKTWVPDWVFAQSAHVEPIFQALAKVMADHESERAALLAETFLDSADAPWIDTHGHERTVARVAGEFDPAYRIRVRTQNLISRCDDPSLKEIVDQLLIAGSCSITDDAQGGLYVGRSLYASRGACSFATIKDAFTISVPKQVHAPYSFVSRGAFANRLSFEGDVNSSAAVFAQVIAAVNANRAFGALFRIIERFN
jgi:hypothetical protein